MKSVQLSRTSIRLTVEYPDELHPLVNSLRHYTTAGSSGACGSAEGETRLRIVDSATPSIEVGDGVLLLQAPLGRVGPHTVQMMTDLTYFRALDEHGIVVLHASVVSDGTSTYAFWGSSGAGKTTTAVALHETRGFSVLSNGSALFRLVDGIPMFLGSAKTHVKLRSSSVSSSGSPLASQFERVDQPAYENKIEKSLGDLAERHVGPPLPLSAFFIIRLVRDLPCADLQPLRRHRAGVEVYEDAVRHLHGLTAVLYDNDGQRLAPLPVLNSDELHASRVALINSLMDRGRSLTGPLDDVTALLGDEELLTSPIWTSGR